MLVSGFRKLRDIRIAAVIVSDQPWLWLQLIKHQNLKSTFLPKPVPLTMKHMSSGKSWNVTRVVLARESFNGRIRSDPQTYDIQSEAFVHGDYVYFILWTLYSFKPHEYAWWQPWWMFSVMPLEIRPLRYTI